MEETMALRGACTVENDRAEEVDKAVKEMIGTLYEKNGITEEDCACIIFSQTGDIRSRNAATACRKAGLSDHVPLFCVGEADTDGALPMALRALVILKRPIEGPGKMVYLGRAENLRPDYKEEYDG